MPPVVDFLLPRRLIETACRSFLRYITRRASELARRRADAVLPTCVAPRRAAGPRSRERAVGGLAYRVAESEPRNDAGGYGRRPTQRRAVWPAGVLAANRRGPRHGLGCGARRGRQAGFSSRRWPVVPPASGRETTGGPADILNWRRDVASRVRGHGRAVGGLQAVLGAAKHRRRGLGAREATGGPRYYRLLRRAADVVAGPRPRERAVGGLQAVLGSRKAPPAWRRSSRGDGRTAVLLPTSASRRADVVATTRGHGSGPSGVRPFSDVKHRRRGSELARRRADRGSGTSCAARTSSRVRSKRAVGGGTVRPRPLFTSAYPLLPAGTLGCKKRAKRNSAKRREEYVAAKNWQKKV